MVKSVYLAGPYPAKATIKARAVELIRLGYNARNRWLFHEQPSTEREQKNIYANEDLYDISHSDYFVMCLDVEGHSRGGMYVELGWALAKRKEVIIVGERTNIFTHKFNVVCVIAWPVCIAYLSNQTR